MRIRHHPLSPHIGIPLALTLLTGCAASPAPESTARLALPSALHCNLAPAPPAAHAVVQATSATCAVPLSGGRIGHITLVTHWVRNPESGVAEVESVDTSYVVVGEAPPAATQGGV